MWRSEDNKSRNHLSLGGGTLFFLSLYHVVSLFVLFGSQGRILVVSLGRKHL